MGEKNTIVVKHSCSIMFYILNVLCYLHILFGLPGYFLVLQDFIFSKIYKTPTSFQFQKNDGEQAWFYLCNIERIIFFVVFSISTFDLFVEDKWGRKILLLLNTLAGLCFIFWMLCVICIYRLPDYFVVLQNFIFSKIYKTPVLFLHQIRWDCWLKWMNLILSKLNTKVCKAVDALQEKIVLTEVNITPGIDLIIRDFFSLR